MCIRDRLDTIIKKLYESFAVGRITDERFDSLLADYEAEQKAVSYTHLDVYKRQIQKRCHNLTRVLRPGLEAAEDHCLLSATALNLKRMIRCME